jgi:hypothetical protein
MSSLRFGGAKRLGSLLFAVCPLLGGCASDLLPSTAPASVAAQVSASIGTVANVTWKTTTPTIGYVSFGITPNVEQSAPLETVSTTAHSRTLLGLTPDTTYYYRVLTWDTANVTAGASDVQSFHTAPLPVGTPSLVAQSFDVMDEDGSLEDPIEAYVIIPFVGAASTTIGIVAPTGALIWYHAETRGRRVTRARLTSDKAAVVYSAISDDTPADSEIVRVALDGSGSTTIRVPDLGADFAVRSDGTLAALVPDVRNVGGSTVTGDRIVEIDAGGAQSEVFSTFDCFDPATSPGDGSGGSWTGANALQVEGSNTYYLSLRNLSTIVKVNRGTGECDWILGDDTEGTLDLGAGSSPFSHPGSFSANADTLVVLDADGGSSGSRMVSYELDLEAKTATQVQAYVATPRVDVVEQGEATLVTSDDVRINWANGSRMEVVDRRGQIKWTLDVTSGEHLGYHTSFRDLYDVKLEGNK